MRKYTPLGDRKAVALLTLLVVATSFMLVAFKVNIVAAQAPEIVAKRIEGGIVLDGVASEDFWEKAPAITVPLSASTAAGGHVKSVTVKAVHNGSWLFILLTWEDPTMNIEHAEEEEEEEHHLEVLKEQLAAAELQDRAALLWYMGGGLMSLPCMKLGTNGAVTEGEADLWHWHAASNNPDSPQYEATAPHPFATDEYTNTQARTEDSGESEYDVWARGKWSNGVWTLELARKFNTKDAEHDVQFKLGETYHVAFAIYDGGSGEDEESKSTSKWYLLEISNEWLIPPTSERVKQLETKVKQLEAKISELTSQIKSLEDSLKKTASQTSSNIKDLSSSIEQIKSTVADIQKTVQELKDSISSVESKAGEALDTATAVSGQAYLAIALAVVALIVAVAAVALSRRK